MIFPIRRLHLSALLSVLTLLSLALPSLADASSRSRSPSVIEDRALVFNLKSLKRGHDVRRAFLTIPRPAAGRRSAARKRVGVSLAKVRTAAGRGRLRVAVPRQTSHAAKRRARLVLTISARRNARRSDKASANGSCVAGSFGVGAWPGGCWRPFAASSPFNTPVPATARVHARSAAMVSRIVGLGPPDHMVAGTADTSQDWSHPTYYSKSSDPLYTLHCTASWGTCAVEGMQVRVPSAARAAGGSDGHMTIVDQASGWEYSLWGVQAKPAGGGTLSFLWSHGRVRIDGSGLNGGGTAAHFSNLAGIIRAQELEAGQINHALFMGIRCDSGSMVYPASGKGAMCATPTDAPPMGARLQLNMTPAQIDALAVPAWKKTVLRAMATYGMYFGDTGGGTWSVAIESGSTYTSFGHEDQMVAFARNNGLPSYNGQYIFNIRDGVDWAKYLRVIDPCTTQGTC